MRFARGRPGSEITFNFSGNTGRALSNPLYPSVDAQRMKLSCSTLGIVKFKTTTDKRRSGAGWSSRADQKTILIKLIEMAGRIPGANGFLQERFFPAWVKRLKGMLESRRQRSRVLRGYRARSKKRDRFVQSENLCVSGPRNVYSRNVLSGFVAVRGGYNPIFSIPIQYLKTRTCYVVSSRAAPAGVCRLPN